MVSILIEWQGHVPDPCKTTVTAIAPEFPQLLKGVVSGLDKFVGKARQRGVSYAQLILSGKHAQPMNETVVFDELGVRKVVWTLHCVDIDGFLEGPAVRELPCVDRTDGVTPYNPAGMYIPPPIVIAPTRVYVTKSNGVAPEPWEWGARKNDAPEVKHEGERVDESANRVHSLNMMNGANRTYGGVRAARTDDVFNANHSPGVFRADMVPTWVNQGEQSYWPEWLEYNEQYQRY